MGRWLALLTCCSVIYSVDVLRNRSGTIMLRVENVHLSRLLSQFVSYIIYCTAIVPFRWSYQPKSVRNFGSGPKINALI